MNIYKKVIQAACLASLAVFPINNIFAEGATQDKPNVLLIFADDQRWDTIAALGNPDIITPNLDKLAKQSIVFTEGFCFGGNVPAVCIPARNMLMSGQTWLRFEEDWLRCKKAGIDRLEKKKSRTNPKWPNFPRSMKAAGYETYMEEKSAYANNPFVALEFDHHASLDMPLELATGRAAKNTVDHAIDFIENKRDKSKPFFMYMGLPCPHDPRWAAKEFRDMYKESEMKLPPNYLPQHPHNITDMVVRDESLEKWPRTEEAIKRHLHDYYALITAMDYDLGRLFDKIEALGLNKNTIIIYAADQGVAVGSKGLLGKQAIYDDIMRVPFMFKIPGMTTKTVKSFVYTHDIYPTVLDLVGGKIPTGLDGKSLKPILFGEQQKVRDYMTLGYKHMQRSVSDGEWKIIRFPHIDKTELYNVSNDRHEVNNLAYNPEFSGQLERMMTLLKEEQKRNRDILPLTAKKILPAIFVPPTVGRFTPYPAGGLAPGVDDLKNITSVRRKAYRNSDGESIVKGKKEKQEYQEKEKKEQEK